MTKDAMILTQIKFKVKSANRNYLERGFKGIIHQF